MSNNKKTIRSLKIPASFNNVLLFAFLILVILIGYGAGTAIGKRTIYDALDFKDNKSLIMAWSYGSLYRINKLVNSTQEHKRVQGYYQLLEKQYINSDFLMERYVKEDKTYIKRAIIWILGRSGNQKETADFLIKHYYDSNDYLKYEILKSLYRIDPKAFKTFIELNNVPDRIVQEVSDWQPVEYNNMILQ